MDAVNTGAMNLPRALAVGDVLDGFRLEQHLHRGGMANLWRVANIDPARAPLPTAAAMKIPLLRGEMDPTAIVGFEVEQMIMPRLAGPHVPRFYAASGFEATPYIVMELIEGSTLHERFAQAPLDADEVARIGTAIATALHDLHRQHVIHFDVKPGNVLFRPTGEAVLIDFGLARHDQLPDLLAEEFHLPMGTGPYIAPEQVQGLRTDARSDLFALGVVLYQLVTGARPFGDPNTRVGLKRRLYRIPVPPRALVPACPPWLQEVILRCIETAPAERYGSAAQVAFDLTHPHAVALTERAARLTVPPWRTRVARWWRALGAEPVSVNVSRQLARAPLVMAAVDTAKEWEALADDLRVAVRRILQTEPDARLACVAVRIKPRIAMDEPADDDGRSLHVKRLVELKHWARPLELPQERVTYHVLEGTEVAAALLEYARTNRVDHLVIGSRGKLESGRAPALISSRIVAEAPCTVTVVKTVIRDPS
ncbi:MAG TPA: bifunctional serine/threonine-protein kinase/universal stress protein [Burkholderiaceae bacterium]|nr:bifunctional serine/threonine-protein kinase/universal stress protein [Burkholderiaceae bacterium]